MPDQTVATTDQIARLQKMGYQWPPKEVTLDSDTQKDLEALGLLIPHFERELAKAKAAKLDTTEIDANLKKIKEQREALLKTYGK